jgi:hypothetical protein
MMIIFSFLYFSACNKVDIQDNANNEFANNDNNHSSNSNIDFQGLETVSFKNDKSVILNWIPHSSAVAYDLFNTTSSNRILIDSIYGQARDSIIVANLTPSTKYRFRILSKNINGIYDGNTNDLEVTTNSAPDAPSKLALLNPLLSPGHIFTPIIKIEGVKKGDEVGVFSDSNCNVKLASKIALDNTIDISVHLSVPGEYHFYSSSTNELNNTSACSSSSVNYMLQTCPEGYIPVPANANLGVGAFCVAKYEMKCVGAFCPTSTPGMNAKAVSQPGLNPWTTITQTNAKNACTAIGAGYDLISNPEWMTIAIEIEKNSANWSGGIVGLGVLNRGHSDNSPSGSLQVLDINDAYNGTNNNIGQSAGSGWEQKRTHNLSNNEAIWDFSGNVWEWVDWSLGGELSAGPSSCIASWTQLPLVSCADLAAGDYLPSNPAGVSSNGYNGSYGLGYFAGGVGFALRGGYWNFPTYTGVFTLNLNSNGGSASTNGFRCVFRLAN